MKKYKDQQQSGQALIIMVLGLVALLGMIALAIDGGRLYTERRSAQNAADASAMAAVRELGSGSSSITAQRVAIDNAEQNEYVLTEEDVVISDETLAYGSYTTDKTSAYIVKVTICTQIDATFAQFVFSDVLDVCATSEMEVRLESVPFAGFGMVSLSTTCSSNTGGFGIGSAGGGNSGGVEIFGSSILSNVGNPNGNCAFDPPTGGSEIGIRSYICDIDPPPNVYPSYDSAYGCVETNIQSTGVYTCSGPGCSNLGTVESNITNGIPFPDPLADLPTPQCTGNGSSSVQDGVTVYTPGNWADTDLGEGEYLPGIYCIHKGGSNTGFKVTGGTVDATSGVLFYLHNENGAGVPKIAFGGGGQNNPTRLDLRAPGNGTTAIPDKKDCGYTRIEPCTYRGMALFVQQSLATEIGLGGNASYDIYGTIYGANATLATGGGGGNPMEMTVYGQVLVGQTLHNGNGSLKVYYDENLAFTKPPYINALQ